MRRIAKRLIEGVAVRSGVPRVAGLRVRGRRLILAYHNVIPRGERAWGETSLHIPAARFGDHMDVLAHHCRVLPLDLLLTAEVPGADRPLVAVTFDDAYEGAVRAGVEEMVRRDLPATFFVAPGLAEESGFWWDRLAHPSGGTLPDSLRSHCLTELQGRQSRVIEWARGEGRAAPAAPRHSGPADESLLHALAEAPGISLSSHTWSHPNLPSLPPAEQAEELSRAQRWFDDHRLSPPPWVAYPYGLQSRTVREATSRTGHVAGLLVEGGWIPRRGADRFAIPRLNVPAGLSAEGLRLRVAGLVPS